MPVSDLKVWAETVQVNPVNNTPQRDTIEGNTWLNGFGKTPDQQTLNELMHILSGATLELEGIIQADRVAASADPALKAIIDPLIARMVVVENDVDSLKTDDLDDASDEMGIIDTALDAVNTKLTQMHNNMDGYRTRIQTVIDNAPANSAANLEDLLPVGIVVQVTGTSANPSTWYGIGTWQPFATGKTLIGHGTGDLFTYDATSASVIGDYGKYLTQSHIPEHKHVFTFNDQSSVEPDHSHSLSNQYNNNGSAQSRGAETTVDIYSLSSSGGTDTVPDHTHTVNLASSSIGTNTGGSDYLPLEQPYVTAYMWIRTA